MDDLSPAPNWPWWTAPAALITGLVLAAVGGLILDIPAALVFGVHVTTTNNLPPGLEIADTVVQDLGFVAAAVIFAGLGGRAVATWQFGLRPSYLRWRSTVLLVVLVMLAFLVFSAAWAVALDVSTKEKLLETLGTNQSTTLLVLSAFLTTVVAPVCEEFLFRGYIFTAFSNWRGPWLAAVLTGLLFGGVHVGSAPVVDLVPLAALGFGLCLLYRATGSLYPCIAAHCLNNCLAFGVLENWDWQIPLLMASSLAIIALAVSMLRSAGVISAAPPGAAQGPAQVSVVAPVA
jgi:uncharacterized protein